MYSLLTPVLFGSLAAAHGHITNIVINGVSFNGWDIGSYPYTDSPPTVVAWGTPNTANGFIEPGMLRQPRSDSLTVSSLTLTAQMDTQPPTSFVISMLPTLKAMRS